jgi:hypothetical protein
MPLLSKALTLFSIFISIKCIFLISTLERGTVLTSILRTGKLKLGEVRSLS